MGAFMIIRCGWLIVLMAGASSCCCFCKPAPHLACCTRLHTSAQTSGGVTTTKTFTYDAKCRISKIKGSDGSSESFTYMPFNYPTQVMETIASSSGTLTITYSLTNGLAMKDQRSNGDYATYQYDGNGYQTEAKYFHSNNSNYFTDARIITSGNITTETQTPGTGTNYTYTTIPYSLNFGEDFLGALNTDAPAIANDGSTQTNFSYVTDAYGRIIKQTRSGGINDVSVFTYE
jgi:hypothetical protein